MSEKENGRKSVEKLHRFLSRAAGWIAAAVYAAVGLCMILFPEMAANVVVDGLSVVLLAAGIWEVIAYLRHPPAPGENRYTLTIGLCLATLGLVILCWPGTLLALLAFLCSASLAVGCYHKLQMAFDFKRWGHEKWWLYLIGAGVSLGMCLIVVLVLMNPVALGVLLIAEGAMDFASQIVKARDLKKLTAAKAA